MSVGSSPTTDVVIRETRPHTKKFDFTKTDDFSLIAVDSACTLGPDHPLSVSKIISLY